MRQRLQVFPVKKKLKPTNKEQKYLEVINKLVESMIEVRIEDRPKMGKNIWSKTN